MSQIIAVQVLFNTPSAVISPNATASECLLTWARVLFMAILWVTLVLQNIGKMYQPKHWDVMLCHNSLLPRTSWDTSDTRHRLAGFANPQVCSKLHFTIKHSTSRKIQTYLLYHLSSACPNDALQGPLKLKSSENWTKQPVNDDTTDSHKSKRWIDKQTNGQNCHDSTMYREPAHPNFCPKNSAAWSNIQ